MDLAAHALHNKPFTDLPGPKRDDIIARLEWDLSDHMPLWVRLPRPGMG